MQFSACHPHQHLASQNFVRLQLPCVPQPLRCQFHDLPRSDAIIKPIRCLQPLKDNAAAARAACQRPGARQQIRASPLEVLSTWKELPNWDVSCAAGVAVFAYVWVKVFDRLASAGVLDQVRPSSGIIHMCP